MARTDVRERTGAEARHLVSEVLEAGLLAGTIGGVGLFLVTGIADAIGGTGFWTFPREVTATFAGAEALGGGAGPVIYGLALHLAVAALWGVPFAALLGRDVKPGYAVLAGVTYGVAVLLFMTFAVLPSVNQSLRVRVGPVPWSWFIAHVVYGLGLALAPWFRRRLAPPLPEGPYPPVRS